MSDSSASRTLRASSAPLVRAFDAALLDLDGVVYRGPSVVEHAAESIQRARASGMRTVFVTNNANRLPTAVAQHLIDLGIPTRPDEVLTSAQAAAALLARDTPAGAPVLVVGGPGLREAVQVQGFTVVSAAADRPAAVVMGFAPTVAWADLAQAAYAVQAGARFVATNLDLTLPTESGVAPGNGTLVGAVRTATGVEPASAGKPHPEIMWQAARQAGSAAPLVVGDRLDTDIAGAVAADMASLLVLTGVHDARAALLAPAAERPTFVASDLRGLFAAHPAPEPRDDGTWACVVARARVRAGDLQLRRSGEWRTLDGEVATVTINDVRALCGAAWEAADSGAGFVAPPRLQVIDDPATAGAAES